jgi:hypothetical protein
MPNLVLVRQAEAETSYTADHIRHLLANEIVKGEKHGRIWLVDLDDLKRYEAEMLALGNKRYGPPKKTDE